MALRPTSWILWALALGALYCLAAAGLVRATGPRTLWLVWAAMLGLLVAVAASRIGTANPFSRTTRWDPFLFALLLATVVGFPSGAATLAITGLARDASHGFARIAAGGFGVLLLTVPVGLVLAVVVEIVWPH